MGVVQATSCTCGLSSARLTHLPLVPQMLTPSTAPTLDQPFALLSIFVALICIASFAGGALATVLKLGHRRLQISLSLVSGVMLGVGLLHLLPHAVMLALEPALEGNASAGENAHGLMHSKLDGVMLAVLVGFALMFLLERLFHYHQHEPLADSHEHDACCDGHHHSPKVQNGRAKSSQDAPVRNLSWIGAAIGMSLHSLLEGVALAAAVLAGSHGESTGAIAGLGTFLVIVLHKPFDSMTVLTLARASGRPKSHAHLINILFSLVVPVGAIAFMLGAQGHESTVLPYALAFAAGTFICIASSDLLPELQFHRHDRVALSVALLCGLAISIAIARVESHYAQSAHSHELHESHESHEGHAHD